jgi:hypothetical protein
MHAALVQLAPELTDFANAMIKVIDTFQQFMKYDASLPLQHSIDDLRAAQEKYAADQAEFARDPDNAYNVYGISQESLRKADADIKQQILDIRAYAEKYGLTDYQGLPSATGGKHGRVQSVVATTGASNPTPPATGKTQAQKDEEEAQKMIGDLQRQIDTLDASSAEVKVAEAIAKIGQASNESKNAVAALTGELESQVAAQKRDAAASAEVDKIIDEATQRVIARQQEAKSAAEAVRTPTEIYADTLTNLSAMLKENAISQETFDRSVQQAKDTMEGADDSAKQFNSAMTELGSTWSSAFEDAALAMDDAGFSAASLGDTLKGLLKDIERIILRLAVSDPIAKGIGGIDWAGLFGGGAQRGGHFSVLVRRLAPAGIRPRPVVAASSWIGSISLFHTGGIAGQGGGTSAGSMPSLRLCRCTAAAWRRVHRALAKCRRS